MPIHKPLGVVEPKESWVFYDGKPRRVSGVDTPRRESCKIEIEDVKDKVEFNDIKIFRSKLACVSQELIDSESELMSAADEFKKAESRATAARIRSSIAIKCMQEEVKS